MFLQRLFGERNKTFLYILFIACLKTKSSVYLSYAANLCEFRALEKHSSRTFKLIITLFSCSSLEIPKTPSKVLRDGQGNIKDYMLSALLSVCFCMLVGFVNCVHKI